MSESPHPNEAWDTHEAGDGEPAPLSIRDLNVPLILTIGVVSVLLLLVAIFGTQAWFNYEVQQEFEKKVVNQPFAELEALNAQQEQTLNGPPAWQDREQGVVSVPIDQAIDRFVAERRQERSPPSTEGAERGAQGSPDAGRAAQAGE